MYTATGYPVQPYIIFISECIVRLPSLSFMYSGFSSGMYRAVLRPGVQLMCADGVHGSGIDLQVNLGLGKVKTKNGEK